LEDDDAWLSPWKATWRPLCRFEPNFTDSAHAIVTPLRDVAAEALIRPC
jgi:hypothetical protein